MANQKKCLQLFLSKSSDNASFKDKAPGGFGPRGSPKVTGKSPAKFSPEDLPHLPIQ